MRDARDIGVHARDGHILLSVPAPLSTLELRVARLVPRHATPIVVYDDGTGDLAARTAARLAAVGYTDVTVLAGGTRAWADAGFHLFTGRHVIGKAFGEWVEHVYDTPRISVTELKASLDAGENIAVLDSRTVPEFHNFSIPGAINLPGAELVLRFQQAVPDPETLVVVNCAGRTRSIIGAQALINAGVPNRVVSLENGTMDWLIAGLTLDHGRENLPSLPQGRAPQSAAAAAKHLIKRFGLVTIDTDTLHQFQAEASRSLYLLDVRHHDEFAAGHVPGSRSAPGGQLVQQSGDWIGTRNARIVLIDSAPYARAAITASWFAQIGWGEVFILRDALSGTLETGPATDKLAAPVPAVPSITPAALDTLLKRGKVKLLDLDPSTSHEAGRIPGAQFAIRSRLTGDVAGDSDLVLTSGDGTLAAFAAAEIGGPVRVLEGGTAAWRKAGLPIETGRTSRLHPAEDVALSPYQVEGDRFAAFRDYLTWEIDLVKQWKRDGTVSFRQFA